MDNKVIIIEEGWISTPTFLTVLDQLKTSKPVIVLDFNHWVDKITIQLKGVDYHSTSRIRGMFNTPIWDEVFRAHIAAQIDMRHNVLIVVINWPVRLINSFMTWGNASFGHNVCKLDTICTIQEYRIPSNRDTVVIRSTEDRKRTWWERLFKIKPFIKRYDEKYLTNWGNGDVKQLLSNLGDLNGLPLILPTGKAKFGLDILKDL